MTPNRRRFLHFFDLCVPKTPSVSRDGSGDCNQARVLETIHFGPECCGRALSPERAANGEMEMNVQATKLQAAENDLKQLMANCNPGHGKAQEILKPLKREHTQRRIRSRRAPPAPNAAN